LKALALLITASVIALTAVGCGGGDDSTDSTAASESPSGAAAESSAEKTKPKVEVPSGAPPTKLEIEEIEPGTGPEAKAEDLVTVQYVGVNYKSGKEFDASWDRGEPFTFTRGAGEVIPGWDQGVEGMKVGGRRELIIPPELGYGAQGAPPAIAPNETLIFVIDLLEVG
jgi:peptidylprolyl isomerase